MESSPLELYDIFMLAILLVAMLLGAWKGFAWQVASLASVVVSAMVAIHFSGAVAPYLSDQDWGRFGAMLILYIGSSLAIWLIFRLVAGFIDRLKLKEFDHQIGGLFGLTKGILLCVVITFFAVTLSETARQAILKTNSGRAIAALIRHTLPVLPEELHQKVGGYLEELKSKLDERTPPTETTETSSPRETTGPAKNAAPAQESGSGLGGIEVRWTLDDVRKALPQAAGKK